MNIRAIKSCLLSLCLTASLPGLADTPAANSNAAPQIKIPMGMNLSGIADYLTGFPFKNLMWGARPWLTKPMDERRPLDSGFAEKIPLDENGYPLELPFQPAGAAQPQYVFTIIPNVTDPGRYVVLYDGEGEITGAMSTKVVSAEPGRVVLDLRNAPIVNEVGYEGIAIKRSARTNHVRNIRILALKDEHADLNQNPFREDFLEYCMQWHALRFMDWMVTNGSLEKEWKDRKPSGFYTMVGRGGDAAGLWGKPPSAFEHRYSGGVPVEIMIRLANLTHTDPWFCMPHRATPKYMTEFARAVKANLDPALKVYVEYSNEVWNWSFPQAGWMLNSKVAADGLAESGIDAWKDAVTPEFTLDDGTVAKGGGINHPERIGVLVRRCFKSWEKVFTGVDRARLVRVIAVQHGWPDSGRRTVKWVMEHGGGDALAPAGYIGPNDEIYKRWEAAGANLTVGQVMADLNEAFDQDSARWTREYAAIARQYHLRYVVYEGGQHLQPKGQMETAYMPALKAAQFSRGLYDIYLRNFALHQEIGCDLFCAFASIGPQGTRYGSWGHQEYYGQPGSEIPKYQALLDVNTPK